MKVLFCSLNSPGWLYPAIGVAKVLQRLGHTVAFATDISCREELERQQVERIPRGQADGPSFQIALWYPTLGVQIQLKHIEYALASFAPDVIVGQQLTFGPLLAAERHHIPVAIIGLCTYLWPATDLEFEDRHTPLGRLRLWRYEDMIKGYNVSREAVGLHPVPASSENPFLGDVFLLRTTSALEGDIERLPRRVHTVGPLLFPRAVTAGASDRLQAWLERRRGAPLIYVNHGRFFDAPSFWPGLVQAFAQDDVSVVAATGRMDSPVGQLPEHFYASSDIDQTVVLPRAAAMISSANTTAVLGALTAGVPALLIPAGGEQPDLAETCRAAGVARVLRPKDASASNIKRELSELLSSKDVRSCVRVIADDLSAIDSHRVAADLIVAVSQKRSPILRSVSEGSRHLASLTAVQAI